MNKPHALLFMLLVSSQTFAGDNLYEGVATEVTQLRNNIELIAQVTQQVLTVEELVKQYENMLLNTEGWEEIFSGQGMDLLLQLAEAVKRNRIISYAGENIETQFEEAFPGYEAYLSVEAPDWTPQTMDEKYTQWNESHRNSIIAAMDAVQLQHNNFDNELEIINALELQTATSAGRQQALVAANQIAIEQLKEAKGLKQMIMTQVQLQSNYMAYEQNRQSAEDAAYIKRAQQRKEWIDGIDPNDGAGF